MCSFKTSASSQVKVMSNNYKVAKDLEGQVLTLIEAIVPEAERAEAAKSIFRRLFHEWVQRLDVGEIGYGSDGDANTKSRSHTASHQGMTCKEADRK